MSTILSMYVSVFFLVSGPQLKGLRVAVTQALPCTLLRRGFPKRVIMRTEGIVISEQSLRPCLEVLKIWITDQRKVRSVKLLVATL